MHTRPPNTGRRVRGAAERIVDRVRDFATPPRGSERLGALTAFACCNAEGGAPTDV